MFVGDFDKIIPLESSEVNRYIAELKNTIAMGGNHGRTNFEIVLLKTLEGRIIKGYWWCSKCKKFHPKSTPMYPVYDKKFFIFAPYTCEKPKGCEKKSTIRKWLTDIYWKHHG